LIALLRDQRLKCPLMPSRHIGGEPLKQAVPTSCSWHRVASRLPNKRAALWVQSTEEDARIDLNNM